MHDIIPEKNPAKPIMDESHLQIIKALSYGQISSKTAWAADSIKNKGNGVIILLHGDYLSPTNTYSHSLISRSSWSWENLLGR